MSDETDPLAWTERAEEDYALARLALRQKKPLLSGCCFHAQQCTEKYLKAILVSQEVAFPKVHDLLLLSELCEKAGVWVAMEAKQLHTLSDYAIRARYPGDAPTPDEAHEALKITKAVRRFARTWLGIQG